MILVGNELEAEDIITIDNQSFLDHAHVYLDLENVNVNLQPCNL